MAGSPPPAGARSPRGGSLLAASLASALALAACLGPLIPGDCSDEERAAFDSFDHYGTDQLVPEADPLGGCRGTFTTGDDPALVIEHFETALVETGWTVSPAHTSPIIDAGGAQIGTSVDLRASLGEMAAEISAEVFDDQPGSWVVLVHRSSQ